MIFLNLQGIEAFVQSYQYGDAERNRERMLQIIYQLRDYIESMEREKQRIISEHMENAMETDVKQPLDSLAMMEKTDESMGRTMALLKNFNRMKPSHPLYQESLEITRKQMQYTASLTEISNQMLQTVIRPPALPSAEGSHQIKSQEHLPW